MSCQIKNIYRSVFVVVCILLISIPAFTQVASFQKKVLDSLPANTWLGNVGLGINFNKSAVRRLFLTSSVNVLYPSQLHSYNLKASSFSNGSDIEADDNWLYAIFNLNLLHHRVKNDVIIERKFNPELFTMFQFDRARGITQRWQNGVNIVWNNSKLKNIRFNMGTGIFIENEKWRVFTKADYAIWDTLSPVVQDLIRSLLKMDQNNDIVRHNTRWNLYLNAYASFGKIVSLNTFFSVQTPFNPPYKDLPSLTDFPTVTKIYPRYTLETILLLRISKTFSINSKFYLQHDRGQISPFTPDEVFNFSQGFNLTF